MYTNTVEFACLDCTACKNPKPSGSAGFMRAAKGLATFGMSEVGRAAGTMARKLDAKSCSLCEHKAFDHERKIETPSFAFTPKGGEFDFESSDGLGFRSVICVQSAATSQNRGPAPREGTAYSLVFLHDCVEVAEVLGGGRVASVPYERLAGLEVGGPGVQTKGGGFAGGGFGLAGFAVGAVAAGMLNKLTTRTTVQTLLRVTVSDDVATTRSEWVFLTPIDTPEAIASILRPITLRLELASNQRRAGEYAPAPGGDKTARLKELVSLRDSGVLTDEEFDALKREILNS